MVFTLEDESSVGFGRQMRSWIIALASFAIGLNHRPNSYNGVMIIAGSMLGAVQRVTARLCRLSLATCVLPSIVLRHTLALSAVAVLTQML